MLWLYRFLWIVSFSGIVALLVMASSPRAARSPVTDRWTTVAKGRFEVQVPFGFTPHRDALTQMGMNKPNSPIQLQDALRIERGARTGVQVILVSIRSDLMPSSDGGSAASPEQQAARLLQQVHEMQFQNLSKVFADLKAVQHRRVSVQRIPGLRTDFEFTLTHWIPWFNLPARGSLITVPVSQTEALHFVSYCPPHQYDAFQPAYDRMLNTLRLNPTSATTASGGW